ncbi:MAG: hypothetical protein J0H82_03125 [Alphaproteobacteria bacterium]|jgi:hypothetical protein|nr:hypothetical protein [Alphaproteobacteria bacterium]
MASTILLRGSVVLLLVGLCLGIGMGMAQNFTLAPAHAHLNLVAFVLPFAAGLYYRVVPGAGASRLAVVQALLALLGGIVLPAGIAVVVTAGPHWEPIPILGSLIVLAAWAIFAVIVFRSHAPRPA